MVGLLNLYFTLGFHFFFQQHSQEFAENLYSRYSMGFGSPTVKILPISCSVQC